MTLFELSPPTDNLYKFMAVFGIVMMVTGFLLDQKTRRDFAEALTELRVQHSNAEKGMRLYRAKSDELLDRLRDNDASTPEGQKREIAILREMGRLPDLDPRKSDDYIRAEGRYKTLAEMYVSTGLLALGLQMGGVAGAGFWLWYHRLQKRLDQLQRGTAGDATQG